MPNRDRPGEFWSVGGIFDLIVEHAWRHGEPGLVFLDAVNRANPVPDL